MQVGGIYLVIIVIMNIVKLDLYNKLQNSYTYDVIAITAQRSIKIKYSSKVNI